MKANLALFLAVGSLVASVIGLLSRPRVVPVKAAATAMQAGPALQMPAEETEVTACPASQGMSLRDLMKGHINPSLTQISYTLHHNRGALSERMEKVRVATATLLGCIQRAAGYTPRLPVSHLAGYYRFIDDMQETSYALQVSAAESDEDGVRHWFSHLKQSCVACHSRFRASGADEDTQPKVPAQ